MAINVKVSNRSTKKILFLDRSINNWFLFFKLLFFINIAFNQKLGFVFFCFFRNFNSLLKFSLKKKVSYFFAIFFFELNIFPNFEI